MPNTDDNRPLPGMRLLALSSFAFALSLTSHTLEPALLGHKVLELAAERRNTALGLITFAGLLIALLVQPLIGLLSDRSRTGWGRRLPYMAAGTLLLIVCLYLVALAPSLLLLLVAVLALQLASNTVQAPGQALIPDLVPAGQRGLAAGQKALLELLGFVFGRLAAGELVSRHAAWGPPALLAAVSLPAAAGLLMLLLTALGSARARTEPAPASHATLRQLLACTFAVDRQAYPAFRWWFANRLLFWTAFLMLSTFLLFFVIDVAAMPQAEAQRLIGRLSLLMGLVLIAITLPAGKLADRLGRRALVVGAGLICFTGTLLVVLARERALMVAGGLLVALGVAVFLSSSWAMLTDIVPRAEAARYLGLANIATAGGSACARLLGATLIDPLNAALDSRSAGYLLLYSLAAVFFLLSALVAYAMPLPQPAAPREPER